MTGCIVEYDHNRKSDYDTEGRVTFQSLKNFSELLATLELELTEMVLILREEHKKSVQKSSLNEEPYFVKWDTDIQKVHIVETTKTNVKY